MIHDVSGRVDIVALIRSARAHGRVVHLVPAGADKATSLSAFADALAFPDWFGGNLDALADSLRTFVRQVAVPVEVIWDGVRTLSEEDPEALAGIRSVLEDTATAHPELHVTVVDRL